MTSVTAGRWEYAVLIADDDPAMRDTLREVVASAGFATLMASCGEEALDVVGQNAVHLALFDMHMPGLTGLETLQLVRQTHAVMPAILVTADPSRNLMIEAQKASVYCILPKPVRKDMVLFSVTRAIQRHYGADLTGD
jgi:DNA-binding NtrC family response regulator